MNLFTTYGLDIEENLSLSHKYQGEWGNYKIASIHLSELIRFTEARASIVELLKQSLSSRDESKPSLIETVYIENQGDNLHDKAALYQKARNRFSKIVQSHNYRELSYEEGGTSYFDSGWDQMVNTPAIFIYGIPNKGAAVLTEDEKSLVEDIKRIDRDLKGICSNFKLTGESK